MSASLIAANPADLMVIRNITPNVVTFSVPFARFGRIQIGGRGTLVRLTSGNLAVFSPIALTEEAKAKVAELGGNQVFIKEGKRNIRISEEFNADFDYKQVLIEADLMFNLPATEQYSKVPESERPSGFLNRIFQSVQNTGGEATWPKRFNWHLATDRNSMSDSLKVINQCDFTTLIPCHGDILEGNGKEVFRKIFQWHLQGKM
ncbi:hypothetical protein V8C42DRAFT_355841 [Trichoderma barbatum]